MRKNSKSELKSFENSIAKSNRFSMAKLNHGLTLRQMQLLSYAIYCTQHKTLDFRLVDFEKYFNINTYHYKEGDLDAKKISTLQFSESSLEKEKSDYLNVFQRVSLENGLFTVKWTEDLLPHIMELRDHYVLTDLTITSKFKSSFSWLLYDYLKAHHRFWHKEISKDALLRFFVVENNKSYQTNTALFKKRVLDVAVKEINEYTELEASYKEVKQGRKTVAFDLIWSKGDVKVAAPVMLIKEIERYIEMIREDSAQALEIDDIDKLKRVFAIGHEAMALSQYVEYPPTIDKEYAEFLLLKLKMLLDEVHELSKQKQSNHYNWLDIRE